MLTFKQYKKRIEKSPQFQSLTEREQEILEMRYGLKGEKPQTLREIGEHFNVSKERVRQVEAKALWKLEIPLKQRSTSN